MYIKPRRTLVLKLDKFTVIKVFKKTNSSGGDIFISGVPRAIECDVSVVQEKIKL
jgi:hypothetical protein